MQTNTPTTQQEAWISFLEQTFHWGRDSVAHKELTEAFLEHLSTTLPSSQTILLQSQSGGSYLPVIAEKGVGLDSTLVQMYMNQDYGKREKESAAREELAEILGASSCFWLRDRDTKTILFVGFSTGHSSPSWTNAFLQQAFPAFLELLQRKEANEHHQRWSHVLEQLLAKTPLSLVHFDADGDVLRGWGKGLEELLTQSGDWSRQGIGQAFQSGVWEQAFEDVQDGLTCFLPAEAGTTRQTPSFDNLLIPDPFLEGQVLQISLDVSQRLELERELNQLKQVVEQSPASVILLDAFGDISFVNRRFEECTGYPLEEVIGLKPDFLRGGLHTAWHSPMVLEEVRQGLTWRGEWQTRRRNGEVVWEEGAVTGITSAAGEIQSFVVIAEDISQRKEYEEKILQQANFDALTRIPNRSHGLQFLEQSIAQAEENQQKVALLFIDLDNFKKVNDNLGHTLGDRLLQEAAQRLQRSVRPGDVVARFGGDEFFLILPAINKLKAAEVVTDKLLKAFKEPFVLDGHEVFLSVSLGVTLAPEDGRDPRTLLHNADAAMKHAKSMQQSHHFFTSDVNSKASARLKMEAQLHRALERGEFSLRYQPFFNVHSQRVCGAEALIRWENPHLGSVSPVHFIPLAEETGLITSIGEWVLREACQQTARWLPSIQGEFQIAVNTSARQFREEKFLEQVQTILRETGLPSKVLEVEVTESLLLDDTLSTEQVQKTLEALRTMGISVSIDDFGTGYSSLSYLHRFPFDHLKIDRSFVQNVARQADHPLILAILAMAESLGLEVTGEGVETVEQFQFFHQQQCHRVQGYLISKPLTAEDFESFLLRSQEASTRSTLYLPWEA